MDYILITIYFLLFALLSNKWGFFAFLVSIVSFYFSDDQLFFIITSLCYTPLCLHNNKGVALSSLTIVTVYYAMAWENAISDTYFLSDNVYMFITFMLNLALIVSLIKSGKDGICNTDIDTAFHGLHDNKLNNSHSKITQGRQTT